MAKLFYSLSSFIFLLLITFTALASSSSFETARKANFTPCCNEHDPRIYGFGGNYVYSCIENGVLVDKTLPWQCCWDAWNSNGWNAPANMPCPPENGCVGPGESFH